MLQGTSRDSLGNEFYYTQIEEPAGFENGMEAFYGKLVSNLKYPTKARRKRIEGMVYVQFVVNKEGELEDISVIKSPAEILNAPAVRAIAATDGWIAPKQRGQKVRQRIILPLKFSLG